MVQPRDRAAPAPAGSRRPAVCANGWSLESGRKIHCVCPCGGQGSQGSRARSWQLRANDPNETPIQYDLYRVPFNDGKGGTPERIVGASQNGMSNNFPKVSPDGRWIVFVQCHNGQLDAARQPTVHRSICREARRAECAPTQGCMNSWHSFSPNGHWLVFSSKARSPYTQMYLTHIDTDGQRQPGDPHRQCHRRQPRDQHPGIRQYRSRWDSGYSSSRRRYSKVGWTDNLMERHEAGGSLRFWRVKDR